jgi:hypothetical protein
VVSVTPATVNCGLSKNSAAFGEGGRDGVVFTGSRIRSTFFASLGPKKSDDISVVLYLLISARRV